MESAAKPFKASMLEEPGMSRQIVFTAIGKPQSQGSKNAFRLANGRTVLVEASKGLKPWRETVALACKQAMMEQQDMRQVEGAVRLDCTFYFVKPKSVTRERPSVKPDLDKVCRGIGDALTGVAWKDDSQVVELNARKVYGLVEMAEIIVTEL